MTDATGAVLPGVTIRAVHEASGNSFEAVTDARGVYRMPRAGRRLRHHGAAHGLYHGHAARRRVAGRPDGRHQPADDALGRGGNGDGHRGNAARQHRHVESGRQRRPAPGAGTAGGAAQLDGPRAAGSWQPHHVDERDAAPLRGPARRRHARVSTERRRAAGVVGTGRRQSAALQPGLDRRVPVHREPVRRHRGPLDGRAGERHHEVRHQHVLGAVPHQFPEQQLQRARSDRQQGAPDQRSAVQHGGRRSDRQGQAALLRQLRERAAPADQRLDDAVHDLQRGAAREGDSQYRRRADRLSVVAEDAPDGEGLRPAYDHAVWRRLLDDRGGVDHRHRREERRVPRSADDGDQQPRAQRDQGRVQPLRVSRTTRWSTGPSTGRRRTASPTATRASRSPASRSTPTPTRRGIATRMCGSFATTSRYSFEGARPSRHEDRRGIRAPLRGQPELRAVRRHHRRARHGERTRDSDAGHDERLVPRPVQREHVEPRGAVAVGAHLHHRHRQLPQSVRRSPSSAGGCRTTGVPRRG